MTDRQYVFMLLVAILVCAVLICLLYGGEETGVELLKAGETIGSKVPR